MIERKARNSTVLIAMSTAVGREIESSGMRFNETEERERGPQGGLACVVPLKTMSRVILVQSSSKPIDSMNPPKTICLPVWFL
jgi:hypothetical protein